MRQSIFTALFLLNIGVHDLDGQAIPTLEIAGFYENEDLIYPAGPPVVGHHALIADEHYLYAIFNRKTIEERLLSLHPLDIP